MIVGTIEMKQDGSLDLPPELLASVPQKPVRYTVEITDNVILLRPEPTEPLWAILPVEKRVDAFLDWVAVDRPKTPALALEDMSRDSIYD